MMDSMTLLIIGLKLRVSVFCFFSPLSWMGMMLADFQADRKQLKEDKLKSTDKREGRAGGQDFKTWALIP